MLFNVYKLNTLFKQVEPNHCMTTTQIHDLDEMLNDLLKLRSNTKEIFKILSNRDVSNLTNSTSLTLYSASNSLADFNEKFSRVDIQNLIEEKNQKTK